MPDKIPNYVPFEAPDGSKSGNGVILSGASMNSLVPEADVGRAAESAIRELIDNSIAAAQDYSGCSAAMALRNLNVGVAFNTYKEDDEYATLLIGDNAGGFVDKNQLIATAIPNNSPPRNNIRSCFGVGLNVGILSLHSWDDKLSKPSPVKIITIARDTGRIMQLTMEPYNIKKHKDFISDSLFHRFGQPIPYDHPSGLPMDFACYLEELSEFPQEYKRFDSHLNQTLTTVISLNIHRSIHTKCSVVEQTTNGNSARIKPYGKFQSNRRINWPTENIFNVLVEFDIAMREWLALSYGTTHKNKKFHISTCHWRDDVLLDRMGYMSNPDPNSIHGNNEIPFKTLMELINPQDIEYDGQTIEITSSFTGCITIGGKKYFVPTILLKYPKEQAHQVLTSKYFTSYSDLAGVILYTENQMIFSPDDCARQFLGTKHEGNQRNVCTIMDLSNLPDSAVILTPAKNHVSNGGSNSSDRKKFETLRDGIASIFSSQAYKSALAKIGGSDGGLLARLEEQVKNSKICEAEEVNKHLDSTKQHDKSQNTSLGAKYSSFTFSGDKYWQGVSSIENIKNPDARAAAALYSPDIFGHVVPDIIRYTRSTDNLQEWIDFYEVKVTQFCCAHVNQLMSQLLTSLSYGNCPRRVGLLTDDPQNPTTESKRKALALWEHEVAFIKEHPVVKSAQFGLEFILDHYANHLSLTAPYNSVQLLYPVPLDFAVNL
jgi:hypothetical protein